MQSPLFKAQLKVRAQGVLRAEITRDFAKGPLRQALEDIPKTHAAFVGNSPELHAEVVADAYKILAIAVVCGGGDISNLAADAREWSACGLPNIEAADLVKTLRTELYHMGEIRPANVPPLNLEAFQVHNVAELVCLALIAYECPKAMQQIHALGDFFQCCVDPSHRQMLMTNAHHFRVLYAASKIDGAVPVVEYPAI